MQKAAIFDLDGTLLCVNSGKLWMENERKSGRLDTMQTAQAIFYLAAYRVGFIDMNKAVGKAMATIQGMEEQLLQSRVEKWFDSQVKPYTAQGCWSVIDKHREQNHLLVLLTSVSIYEARIALDYFGLDIALATRYCVQEGRFTGEVKELCYGPQKVVMAEKLAEEKQIDLGQSYFYSDSITDLPMLQRVGYPRTVSPDIRLRRLAKKSGWPILDWCQ